MRSIMKKSIIYFSLLLLVISNKSAAQWPSPFNTILPNIQDSITKKVLASPKTYRYQLVYTQIDRDQNGIPSFTNYTLHADAANYFNPASMVKMPLAFLAMEKLYELNQPGVNKFTTMQFDSNYQRQVAMYADTLKGVNHSAKGAAIQSVQILFRLLFQQDFVSHQRRDRQSRYSSKGRKLVVRRRAFFNQATSTASSDRSTKSR